MFREFAANATTRLGEVLILIFTFTFIISFHSLMIVVSDFSLANVASGAKSPRYI